MGLLCVEHRTGFERSGSNRITHRRDGMVEED